MCYYDYRQMSMATGKYKRLALKAIAGSMAVWLSGVVFLFCCHVQNTRAAEMDSCPLVKLGTHCDKAGKEKNSEKVTNQTNEHGMDCCAFIPVFFDKTRTIDTNQQTAVAPPIATVVKPRRAEAQTNFAPAYPYLSTVLSKNNTFLKNRTFRI